MAETARVVLTGATGRLGRRLLSRLVARPRHVQLLVRGTRGASAAIRTDAVLRTLPPGAQSGARRPPLDVTAVDLANDPLEGVVPAAAGPVHIVHCAACADPDAPLDAARRVNVEGTRRILALAAQLTSEGRLQRLDHVSCAHVAGADPGVVTEADLDRGQRFASVHERTKYEAERIVRAAMGRIPVAVHRPSLMTQGPLPLLRWPLPLLTANGRTRRGRANGRRLDVVSVDHVADALVALMEDDTTVGGTYHLTAGLGRELPMEDLLSRDVPRIPRGDVAKYALFRRMRGTPFARMFPDRFWEASWRVARWIPYVRGSTVRFDSRRTERTLHRLGVAPPPSADEET